MIQNKIQGKYNQLYSRLIRAHRKRFLFNIIVSSLDFIIISFTALLIFLGINFIFEVGVFFRSLFLVAWLFWFTLFTIYKVFPFLKEIMNPSQDNVYRTAKFIGSQNEYVHDSLINFIQLASPENVQGSSIIKNLALEQLYNHFQYQNIDNNKLNNGLRKKLYRFSCVAILFLVLFIFSPNNVLIILNKILTPWDRFIDPIPTSLYNQSGNMNVLKNDSVLLTGYYQGIRPDQLFLIVENINEESLKETNKIEKISINPSFDNSFKFIVSNVRSSFKYFFSAGLDLPKYRHRKIQSSEGIVSVKERPTIRIIQIKIIPPKYTKLDEILLAPNEGEITALRGSQIFFHIEADKQLSYAKILFSDSSILPLSINGYTAKGDFKISKNSNYSVKIYDSDSVDNYNPIKHNVFVLEDEYPFAEIKHPGTDIEISSELRIPLFVELSDDFGFSKLLLKGLFVQQGSSGDSSWFEVKVPFHVFEQGRAFSEYFWDLISFYMIPDDFIQYYIEVYDNDFISGPKSYQTKKYTIRLPSLLEVISKADQKQSEQLEQIKEISHETKRVKKTLDEIDRELKKELEIDWDKKQEIKSTLNKQKKLLEKISDVQREIEDLIQQFDKHNLINPETLNKYFELQNLFEELATPELKEAMAKLQDAIDRVDTKNIKNELTNLQLSMEQFEKNISRTYDLFKRIQLEQKMNELISLSERIASEQLLINEKLEDGNLTKSQIKKVTNQEKKLAKDAEYLENKTKETSQDYLEMMNDISGMLEKANRYLEDEQITENFKKLSQRLPEGYSAVVTEMGKYLKSQMDIISSMLRTAQEDMMMQQKQDVTLAMQKIMQEILATSFEQEEIINNSEGLDVASPQMNRIARKQSNLFSKSNQITNQVVELSGKTFFISPQMNKIMTDIASNMSESINQLENRNSKKSVQAQIKAMTVMNQAVLSLQSSMNQLSQSSSASGFQEFMEKLQQLMGQQGQVNQESMDLFQKSQGGRLQLSQDELGRLAAQQELIRQSLNQIKNDIGDRRDLLGRLNELGKEMDEVIGDLKAQKMDRKVIDRQERILSRLLDAQKSIREKEFSKKRIAEREKEIVRKSPPNLKQTILNNEDHLRKELMNALGEGYSAEYKEYIKKYFEKLYRRINN